MAAGGLMGVFVLVSPLAPGLHVSCTYVTRYKTHMRTHLLRHLGKRPFECHLCPATFTERSKLKLHVRAHTGKRPFPCDFCDASFNQRNHLIEHIYTHTGERPFSCDRCPACVGSSYEVSKWHTSDIQWLCSSSKMSHQQYHSLVFVQDRLHSCRQCTYVTKYKTHMRTHLLKHLNQHPYECHLCPATFAEKFKLTLHCILLKEEPPQ
nr:zinc finger protein 776-like [Rhipicephalus microplus]